MPRGKKYNHWRTTSREKSNLYPSPEKVSSAHGWPIQEVTEDNGLTVNVIMVRTIAIDKRISQELVPSWHARKQINHEPVSSPHVGSK